MEKTERIEFADTGDHWEFKTWISVGVEREYLRVARESQDLGEDASKLQRLTDSIDAITVRQTVAWSYGPITVETLRNEVPSHHYGRIGERMGELYLPLVVESVNRLANASSSPSKPGETLQKSSESPAS